MRETRLGSRRAMLLFTECVLHFLPVSPGPSKSWRFNTRMLVWYGQLSLHLYWSWSLISSTVSFLMVVMVAVGSLLVSCNVDSNKSNKISAIFGEHFCLSPEINSLLIFVMFGFIDNFILFSSPTFYQLRWKSIYLHERWGQVHLEQNLCIWSGLNQSPFFISFGLCSVLQNTACEVLRRSFVNLQTFYLWNFSFLPCWCIVNFQTLGEK